MEAENIYENTIGKVSPTDSIVLHHSPINKIMKSSQEHLDAHLALRLTLLSYSAMRWQVKSNHSGLHCCMQCGLGVAWF
jgi:hypothetical protein